MDIQTSSYLLSGGVYHCHCHLNNQMTFSCLFASPGLVYCIHGAKRSYVDSPGGAGFPAYAWVSGACAEVWCWRAVGCGPMALYAFAITIAWPSVASPLFGASWQAFGTDSLTGLSYGWHTCQKCS